MSDLIPPDVIVSAAAAEREFVDHIDAGDDFDVKDIFAKAIVTERTRCVRLARAWSAWGSVAAERIAVAIDRGESA